MFFIRQKIKLTNTGFFEGFIDWHSHILPGVDDGIKTAEEALDALDYFSRSGIKKVVFTPHVMHSLPNDRESLLRSFHAFRKQYDGDVALSLGAEYMLDSGFERQFENELLYLDGNKVLVETSYLSAPKNLYEQLFQISVNGNIPVIAHPERYLYMRFPDYYQLKNKDYLLQLNLLSLTGYYGPQVMKNAIYLLEQGMYDMIGTDLHQLETFRKCIDALRISKKQSEALNRLKENTLM